MPKKQKRKCYIDEQNSDQTKIIGQRFRLFRKSKNLTQSQVANLLSTSTATVANIETGRNNLRIEYLLIMRAQFDINSNWLLSGEGEMTAAPLKIPENWRELLHYMNVPEVELVISAKLTEVKKLFKEEIPPRHGEPTGQMGCFRPCLA